MSGKLINLKRLLDPTQNWTKFNPFQVALQGRRRRRDEGNWQQRLRISREVHCQGWDKVRAIAE